MYDDMRARGVRCKGGNPSADCEMRNEQKITEETETGWGRRRPGRSPWKILSRDGTGWIRMGRERANGKKAATQRPPLSALNWLSVSTAPCPGLGMNLMIALDHVATVVNIRRRDAG